MTEIVLATHNAGKVAEVQSRLEGYGFVVRPLSNYDAPAPEETGLTFVENAIIKARHACDISGLPALSDDSGLEVDALQGAPGIYSSRYAGDSATSTANNNKLLRELKNVEKDKRTARFQCVIVFMRHAQDPTPIICQAHWSGLILEAPRGEQGFGYDPIFFLPDRQCSAAELPPEVKKQISHRGQALTQLAQKLSNIREK